MLFLNLFNATTLVIALGAYLRGSRLTLWSVAFAGLQEPICPGTPGGSRMWYATKCLGADLEMPQLYSSMPRVAYPKIACETARLT